MRTFFEVFTWIWIIGGILLLPFNSLFCGFLICTKCKLDMDRWFGIVKGVWVLQIVWNLVFFSISLCGSTALEAEKGKITYTLTRGEMENIGIGDGKYAIWKFNPDVWDFHFYKETAKGKTEIDPFSEEATPFQKAYWETGIEKGLDPEGLPNVRYSDGSLLKVREADKTGKIIAFDACSEEEARAYIDRYNTPHPASFFFSGIFPLIIVSVIAPFLYTFAEALVLSAILLIISNPLLATAVYGPTIYRLFRVGAFRV